MMLYLSFYNTGTISREIIPQDSTSIPSTKPSATPVMVMVQSWVLVSQVAMSARSASIGSSWLNAFPISIAWCARREARPTPFRRPPYSLVGNGFMVMGDAAFMTKPFSGEGVTSSSTACQIASEVASKALEKDDVRRPALWPYNVRYFQDQGAKFAGLLAQLPAAAELSAVKISAR